MVNEKFGELTEIMSRLRRECPWDREQTHDSIKASTIEEAYEAVHAIDEKDYNELKKELGDLLLHVLFHSAIAEEANHFNINDVIDSLRDKLVRRHPHIFGDAEAGDADKVKQNWEAIKLSEGRESLLDGIPPALPALLKAYRMQDKASKVGFDWKRAEDAYAKVVEETAELHEAVASGNQVETEKEFGDLLFALINYSRFIGVNPEDALRGTNKKFDLRFRFIEQKLAEKGRKITESNLEEMDVYWNESKALYK